MPLRVQTAGAALYMLLLLAAHSAHARLVLAQRGTVNIVDRSVHVALSLPVFTSYVVLGFEHIASGLDHMLFLLVVVSTGWSLRRLLLVLTWFTLGHAVTLTASLLGVLSVSPAVVEPAIAAIIIGMALLDFWALRQTRHGQVAVPMRTDLRLVMIFACALIHGLGLADALSELGLDSTHRWLSLAGFNLGIELCQVAFAVVALSLVAALRYRWGPVGVRLWSYLLTSSAVAIASVWLVQRVVASQAA